MITPGKAIYLDLGQARSPSVILVSLDSQIHSERRSANVKPSRIHEVLRSHLDLENANSLYFPINPTGSVFLSPLPYSHFKLPPHGSNDRTAADADSLRCERMKINRHGRLTTRLSLFRRIILCIVINDGWFARERSQRNDYSACKARTDGREFQRRRFLRVPSVSMCILVDSFLEELEAGSEVATVRQVDSD